MNIEHFGKGLIRTPDEVRLKQYRLAAGAPPVIDWVKGYDVEQHFNYKLKTRNQRSSLSCTGQATAYYGEMNHFVDNHEVDRWSARHIYSQVFIPPAGGAYIWQAMSIPLTQGFARLDQVPEGDSSEATMRDRSLNGGLQLEAKADKYAVIQNMHDIDVLAQCIIDYNGFVTGFNGSNQMFDGDGMVVDWSAAPSWAHAIWVCGFGMKDGKKVLKFKNSWDLWGDNSYGYFPEGFVESGSVYDAYVYADVLDLDATSIMLTEKDVRFLQALEGYHDEEGVKYWTGQIDGKRKTLADYRAARLPDKIKELTDVQTMP